MKVKNILHGGKKDLTLNFGKLKSPPSHHITYEYISIDGEQGFPGELKTTCKYSIQDNELFIINQSQYFKTNSFEIW